MLVFRCFTSCIDNADFVDDNCECNDGYYSRSNFYNVCPDLCSTCTSGTVCVICEDGAELGDLNLCQCKDGSNI